MYGVFAAIACFHNLYTVIKNVTTLSQGADIAMNTLSLYGMLLPNLTNWTWQTGYLLFLISKVNAIVTWNASFHYNLFSILNPETFYNTRHFLSSIS